MKFFCSSFSLSLLAAATMAGLVLAPSAGRAQGTPTTTTAAGKVADLSGTLTGFQIKTLTDGMLKVKGTLTIANLGEANAKNVRANFYVSTDTEVDPADLVHTVSLADYNSGSSKLKHGSQIVIPLKQKVVAFIGSLLNGQYLLVELVADNNTPTPADKHNVIAIGPVSVTN